MVKNVAQSLSTVSCCYVFVIQLSKSLPGDPGLSYGQPGPPGPRGIPGENGFSGKFKKSYFSRPPPKNCKKNPNLYQILKKTKQKTYPTRYMVVSLAK